ncbi:type IIA DNA topoisomerase subunit B [Sedimentibacter sp. B4]|uniref:DNA gyrase/topoisomerase IV subunit B n=1 Tax=Sedimentibacter sp. B4 TaxID=304766 RepID=UPI0002ED772B|nr:DNA gyrase subunit B [Sedimentibacter sp. B4]
MKILVKEYNAKSITVLEGLAPVRVRPGMYIGSTGSKGLHHLIWEIIDNSVDEHLAGVCTDITITLNNDGSVSVEDNGRGMPTELHDNTLEYPKTIYPRGVSAERILLTVLHSGGKFNNDNYVYSGGLHGVGVSVVNALSSYMKVEVFKDSKHYVDEYVDGGNAITELDNGELKSVGFTRKKGTKITFMPDSSIFENITFQKPIIIKKLKEIAYLNKGLTMTLVDKSVNPSTEDVFHEEEGLVGYIKDLTSNKDVLYETPISITAEGEDCYLEFAMQHTQDYNEVIVSFCNNINTIEGGTHVTGMKSALTKTINKFAAQLNMLKNKNSTMDGKDIRTGLNAIINVKVKNPQFDGQTKSKLGNLFVKTSVETLLSKELEVYFDKDLELVKTIIEQSLKFEKIRVSEGKSKENALRKPSVGNKKLASCQQSYNKAKGILTEIFLVEGDSAGGSAKEGRDRKFQAIFSMFGKSLNVEKVSEEKASSNQKLLPIANAIGVQMGAEDIAGLKYDKVIIMTDADVDGAHIRTLLLTFFYRYMRVLIDEGHVYFAMPPLFKAQKGKSINYFYDDSDFAKWLKTTKNTESYMIQRYKGLGEMNPDQLWETTMNPATRKLKRVSIEDAMEAEQITTTLMGDKVPPRRQFIEENYDRAILDL